MLDTGPKPLRHPANTMDYSSLDGVIPSNPKIKPQDGDGRLTQHITHSSWGGPRVLFLENMQECEAKEGLNLGEIMACEDICSLNLERATLICVWQSGKKRDSDSAFSFDPKAIFVWGESTERIKAFSSLPWEKCNLEEFIQRYRMWWDKGLKPKT